MEKVITVCPYCASGCKLYLQVENNRVVGAEPAQGKNNRGTLCLKGYYGWEFLNDTQLLTPRLKTPMIRRRRGEQLEAVSWEEALDYVANKLSAIKKHYGPDAIMTTGSSRGTGNETNYLMQKFARAVLGTNNVDCCARVCHGPSVAGLLQSVGNGAMSNSITEMENSDLLFIFGYNPAESHPIVANWILLAKQKGAKIIVCDPRRSESACFADLHLPLKNGSNIALLNAIGQVIIEEKLHNPLFINARTEGFEEYRKTVAGYTPEAVCDITGLNPADIRKAARLYASAKSASILWGMGVTQFYQGVETVRSLTSLALLTGHIGRPGTGVNPVRGQNNVQGACDMGALPDTYPGYQPVKDAAVREKFARAWGVATLPEHTGYRITELPHRALQGEIHAAWIMGEDPLQTDPELLTVRQGMKALDLLIVQDIFMTKTAAEADVLLPSTSWGEHEGVYTAADRGFQRFFKAVEPQWDLKTDWQIISEVATRMGYPMHYSNTQAIWDEMRSLCPDFSGATYEKMGELGYIQWPCRAESPEDPGTSWLYSERFDRPNGLAAFYTCDWLPPQDALDNEYPLVLSTVREVGHYSCRSMTGNCRALTTLADEPGSVQINSQDAARSGIKDNELVWIRSRRGRVIARAQVSDRPNPGAIYMTYQWWIGACNELVSDKLSPGVRTPEYKFSAVTLEAIDDQQAAERYVQEEYSKLKNRLRASALEPTL
ncbi:formate dehydrogenase subunit alpha [Mixta calida]|uniref:formate dehydrogenase subunit alpha n=1 Tax=Mixta calida TaxID=665913 RepID=UPI00289BC5D6|nr:formate dehydrogenase subunit alpha [Mixta calida]